MSYDVSFEIDTGAGRSVEIARFSYTYNCAPMFYAAIPGGGGISGLHNQTGEQAYPLLQLAVRHFIQNPELHKKLNPENGFGSYEGALRFVAKLCQTAKLHPLSVISVC